MVFIMIYPSIPLVWDYLSKPVDITVTQSSSLEGYTSAQQFPRFNLSRWLSGDFQDEFSTWFNENFYGRESYIRASNQMYYTFFKKSYMYNQSIIIGKDNQLFEKAYIDDYINKPTMDLEEVDAFVNQVVQANSLLKQQGITFVVLITPSKAFTYPEYLPPAIQNRGRSLSNYERIIPRLKECGINLVDGQQITSNLKNEHPIPLFCQGGTHWNDIATYHTLRVLDQTVKDVTGWNTVPLQISQQYVDNNPDATDQDLANLLNLMKKDWSYPAPHVILQGNDSASFFRPEVVLVGGSFCDRLVKMLMSTGWTNSLDFYSYYDDGIVYVPQQRQVTLTFQPREEYWWKDNILSRDLVILEINETMFDGDHVNMFLEDLLKYL